MKTHAFYGVCFFCEEVCFEKVDEINGFVNAVLCVYTCEYICKIE